jgi:hypothetical protein
MTSPVMVARAAGKLALYVGRFDTPILLGSNDILGMQALDVLESENPYAMSDLSPTPMRRLTVLADSSSKGNGSNGGVRLTNSCPMTVDSFLMPRLREHPPLGGRDSYYSNFSSSHVIPAKEGCGGPRQYRSHGKISNSRNMGRCVRCLWRGAKSDYSYGRLCASCSVPRHRLPQETWTAQYAKNYRRLVPRH